MMEQGKGGGNLEINTSDIVLATIGFSDLNDKKNRPVLIIRQVGDDYLVLPVGSKIKNIIHSIFINNKDFLNGNLPINSYVYFNKPFLINKSLIIKKYGTLNKLKFETIFKKYLTCYLDIFIKIKNNSSNIIPVSGKIFDEKELEYMIESVLDCHWTEGKWNELFEKKLGEFLGIKNVITTNSGSSANLLAFTTLTAIERHNLKNWGIG